MSASLQQLFAFGQEPEMETGLTRRLDLCRLDMEDLTGRLPKLSKPAIALFVGNALHSTARFTRERAYAVEAIREEQGQLTFLFNDNDDLNHSTQSVYLATESLDQLSDSVRKQPCDFIFSMEDLRRSFFEDYRWVTMRHVAELFETYERYMRGLSTADSNLMHAHPSVTYGLATGDLVTGKRGLDGAHGMSEGTYGIVVSTYTNHPWLSYYNQSNHKGALEEANCIVASLEKSRQGRDNLRLYATTMARLRRIQEFEEIGAIGNPYDLVEKKTSDASQRHEDASLIKEWLASGREYFKTPISEFDKRVTD